MSDFCSSYLYQISHLGDDDEEPEFSSATPLEEGDTFFFAPRPLKNLVLVDELESLSPIMYCQIADLANEDTPQLYVACGRGPRSSLRVLRHGLEVINHQPAFRLLLPLLSHVLNCFFTQFAGLRNGRFRASW